MVNLKSAQRVLFVCGKENYRRQILLWDSPENLKPVHAGHLHIEENNVRRKGKNFLNCRGSILTLSNNFDIPELLQSKHDTAPSQRFVVDNQRAHTPPSTA